MEMRDYRFEDSPKTAPGRVIDALAAVKAGEWNAARLGPLVGGHRPLI